MRKYIFPIKLYGLIASIKRTGALEDRSAAIIDNVIKAPIDGHNRYVLLSSEIHQTVSEMLPELESYGLRKRLVIPTLNDLRTLAAECALEVYGLNGVLVYRSLLVDLTDAVSLAVQVELMAAIINHSGNSIDMI